MYINGSISGVVPHVVHQMSEMLQRGGRVGRQSHETHRFDPAAADDVILVHPQSPLDGVS